MACKPSFSHFAKCLKNGADCPARTGDLMITNRQALLKTRADFSNYAPKRPFAVNNLPAWCKPILGIGAAALLANEIRGIILAVPVLYAMAQASTWAAVWVGFCSLAGVALSVLVPVILWRKVRCD